MTYGYDVKEERDELVDLVTRAVRTMSVTSELGAFLVDSFPICTSLDLYLTSANPSIHSAICTLLVSWRQLEEKSQAMA